MSKAYSISKIIITLILYCLYIAISYPLSGFILRLMDEKLPFVFFYHLQAGEVDGPIGDPMMLITGIWIQLLTFWLLFAPLPVYMNVPSSIIVAISLLNEPIILTIIPSLISHVFHVWIL